jgi:DNA polymerase
VILVPPPPPHVSQLPAGTRLVAGRGYSTVMPDMDFETYSEAGCAWDEEKGRWYGTGSQGAKGITSVGLQAYAEHPTTEVLCLAYNLKDGRGERLWTPGQPPPQDLFDHIAANGLLEAWNSGFEGRIWQHVCVEKMGWPPLPTRQLRCAMAKSRANCMPGKLKKAAPVLGLAEDDSKMASGDRLIDTYSFPRSPTKKDSRTRLHPDQNGADGLELYRYCLQDIRTESAIAARVPDLNDDELEYWLVDQETSKFGVKMDVEVIDSMIFLLEQIYEESQAEIAALTGGAVQAASEVAKIIEWLSQYGITVSALDEEAVDAALKLPELNPACRRVLEIRKLTASASVKKPFTMKHVMSRAGRLHDLFIYHSARTGRDAGAGPQPQNLPGGGPDIVQCQCGKYHKPTPLCPWCYGFSEQKKVEWNYKAAEQAIELIRVRDRAKLEAVYGSVVKTISGCLRGLFIADDDHDILATDYSSIEAVVAAVLAGTEWRIDTFRRQECIYLTSASKITGISIETYKEYKTRTGMHHKDRKLGKVAELASGFGGWIAAWNNFGADEIMESEQEIKKAILAWRKASPEIVEMWGGQFRGLPWDKNRYEERFGLEGMAIEAVLNPGKSCVYRGIEYLCQDNVLYCKLLSGRYITYHEPQLNIDTRRANNGLQLSFMGWNSNPKMGAIGWVRMSTYGGKLFENVVQATARDIMVHAVVKLHHAGYHVLLRVHDEIVTQRRVGEGSVEELEEIAARMPHWAQGWPIRAAGGWRGKRYRKD